jgi:hypothetical protein
MTQNERTRENITRRGVLKGTAAAAGTAAVGSKATAYREVFDAPLPTAQEDSPGGRTFTLLAIVGGWIAVEPAAIDGLSNPTLRLMEGETHEVIWMNGDGARHNFVLADENREPIQMTDFQTEQGAVLSFEFTASEEMEEYFCMPHPVQMRGPIELVDPQDVHELRVEVEDGNGNPLEAEVFLTEKGAVLTEAEVSDAEERHAFSNVAARPSPQEDEDPPSIARFDMLENGTYELEAWTYSHERVSKEVTIDGQDAQTTISVPAIEAGEPTQTFKLALQEGQWVGLSPDAIADQTNPTLELEAGQTYAVQWRNEIGRRHDQTEGKHGDPLPGHNFVVASDPPVDQLNTHVRSDFLAEQGSTQTVEFVANEEMGVYLDQSQMNAAGRVNVK